MGSYPGQGTALYVDVLPEYKPDNEDLSESKVVQLGVEKAQGDLNQHILTIRDLSYNEKVDQWTIIFVKDEEVIEVVILDEKK